MLETILKKKTKKKKRKEKFIVFQNFKTNNNVFPSGIKNPVKKENEIDEKSLSFDIDINIGNQAKKNNDISEINLIDENQIMDKKNNPFFENNNITNIKDVKIEGKFL